MNKTDQPIFSAIVAMSENRVIGKNNQLPWRLPADLKHFKKITTGHTILMGRKTYESIGKPLPERTNIIITRDKFFKAPGCIIINSLDAAIQLAPTINDEEIFIIGGAEIYKQFMPHIQRIYLTLVHHHFDGDAFFPELDANEWEEKSKEHYIADDSNPYSFTFICLERK